MPPCRDPLGQLAGPNCYAFVDSQPVDRTDPAGLAPIPGQKWFDENISPYLSESQKKKFQRIFDNGCIGVTLTLLGSLRSHPDLTNCYLELREAKAAQDYLDQREHCCLRNRNRRTLYNTVPRARIFNVQFSDVIVTGWKWDDAEEKHVPDTFGHTRIDPVSPEATRYDLNKHWGLIATSDPRYRTVNFDFLIYVEHMDFWIHANHSAPGMEVKYSTTKQAAEQFQNYRGFNRSFFCVACEATWSFAPPPKVDNDGWRPARPRTSPGGLPRTYPGS